MQDTEIPNHQRYINKMNEIHRLTLEINTWSEPRFKKVKETLRILNLWGAYPWLPFDFREKELKNRDFLKFYLLYFFNFLIALGYLIIKYFQYSKYLPNKISQIDSVKRTALFSPSANTTEFVERTETGFWGEVKFLDSTFTNETIWILIPFKPKQISHKKFAQELMEITKKSPFKIHVLASNLSVTVLIQSILTTLSLQVWIISHIHRLIRKKRNKELGIFINHQNFGKGLAASVLNKCLIDTTFSDFPNLQNSLCLLEGQSWEIALVQAAKRRGIKMHGLIHVPIRNEDTQLLNHFINLDETRPISHMKRILVPGIASWRKLKLLGINENQIQIVEAQRFIHTESRKKHCYSSKSRKILFVSDANQKTTQAFISCIQNMKMNGDLRHDFYIQMHPAFTIQKSDEYATWKSENVDEWALVIFGAETSSFLQKEFSDINIRIFNPKLDTQQKTSENFNVPQINNLSQIDSLCDNPFLNNQINEENVVTDSNFPLWKEVLNELTEYTK